MERVHAYEIVKEFVFYIEGLGTPIKGRIEKDIKGPDFSFSVSHYPNSDRPSHHLPEHSLESIQNDLFNYMVQYTNKDTLVLNKNY